ncbi:MAG: hypothetical protein ACYDA3_09705 [Gaiellaceae bacterium]
MIVQVADTAWTFGWSALVAVGTLALAGVTWRLASSTRKMAVETARLARETADEVAASYRPVIVPVADAAQTYMYEDPHGWTLRITVQNAGAGPAAFVRAIHDPSNNSPENWSLGSLACDENATLAFRVPNHTSMSQVLLDYRDLASRPDIRDRYRARPPAARAH